MDGCHRRDPLPLHSLSEASTSRMCQIHLSVQVTCAQCIFMQRGAACSDWLHLLDMMCTALSLLFSSGISSVKDIFAGQLHLWETERKNILTRCKSYEWHEHILWKTELIAMQAREMMSSLMRRWPEYCHHHTDTGVSSQNKMLLQIYT